MTHDYVGRLVFWHVNKAHNVTGWTLCTPCYSSTLGAHPKIHVCVGMCVYTYSYIHNTYIFRRLILGSNTTPLLLNKEGKTTSRLNKSNRHFCDAFFISCFTYSSVCFLPLCSVWAHVMCLYHLVSRILVWQYLLLSHYTFAIIIYSICYVSKEYK